jgi:hypothetical protein
MSEQRQPSASPAQRAVRESALRRLTRVNRWLIAGSVALTALLAEIAANALPGKTIGAAAAPSKSSRAHARSQGSTSSGESAHSLRAPEQAPQSAGESDEQAAPESGEPAAPTPQSESSQESPPASESAPAQERTPAQEPTPAPEPAPRGESSGPVVSGGS